MSRAATAASAATAVESTNVEIWRDFLLKTGQDAKNSEPFLLEYEVDAWDDDQPEIPKTETVSRRVFDVAGKFSGNKTREESFEIALRVAVHAKMCFLVTRHLPALRDAKETQSYFEEKSDASHVTLMQMVLIGTKTIKMSQTETHNVVRAVNRMIEAKTEYLQEEQYDEDWESDNAFQEAKRVVVSEDKRVHAEKEAWEKQMAKQAAPVELEATDSDSESEAAT